VAAIDAIGVALLALSLAGSLPIVTGPARRAAGTGLRWSAGRLLIVVAGLACVTGFAAFWILRS